jgi:hypothetical protein
MTSRDPLAQVFKDTLVAYRDAIALLLQVLGYLLGTVFVLLPWLILFLGGWRLFLRLYLLPYAFVFVGFALIMAFLNRRELMVRMRNWRAARKPTELRKAA